MPQRLYEHRITHHLDAWLKTQKLSRQELAERMRFSYDYISMVMDGRRSVTDGFLGRFVRTFGWEATLAAFGHEEVGQETGDEPRAAGR
jgi:hypothetical protein